MSSPKKGLQDLHNAIQDGLVRMKPKLDSTIWTHPDARDDLSDNLKSLLKDVGCFRAQRAKIKAAPSKLVDAVDREGVNLWNTASLLSANVDRIIDGRSLMAQVRHLAYRLVEAALEDTPGMETLANILQMASKCAGTLSESGDDRSAGDVLRSAAAYEEMLSRHEDPGGTHRELRACAVVVYLTSRMEVEWRQNNDGVAAYMLRKITEQDDARLALVPPRERERLAFKMHEIGRSMVKDTQPPDAIKAQAGVSWLQRAFAMVEQLEELPGASELKRIILRSLARAYYLASTEPENLARAETSIQELLTTIPAGQSSAEYQSLRWMRLAVLKQRKAPDDLVLEAALEAIVDNMAVTEESVTGILMELRTVPQHFIVTSIHQHCLERALHPHNLEGASSASRLMISLIQHCNKDEDRVRGLSELETAFNAFKESGQELSRVEATASLTLLWQFGDRNYHAKRWTPAADWYLAGTHFIFHTMGDSTGIKCFRKAALCHIQQRGYARASEIIRLGCPPNEAATAYVMFLAAFHQGLEEDAIKAVEVMVNAPDFEHKMLLLAIQLSHTQPTMKHLLLSVLEALLKTMKSREGPDSEVETIYLLRCIIRLILKMLAEPAANMPLLMEMLLLHARNASEVVEVAHKKNKSTVIVKDISWLWRTVYNIAVQGCSEASHADARISDLFDVARQLLEAYIKASVADVDKEVYLHTVFASFAFVSGRVFAARQSAVENGMLEHIRLRALLVDLKSCKEGVEDVLSKASLPEADVARVKQFILVLRVFQVEILCQMKDWDSVGLIISEALKSNTSSLKTYEAIADILWAEGPSCPVGVLYTTLEAILHTSLDREALTVEKFSRWLRAICTILLSRNTAADRAKAVAYAEQAVVVMGSQDGESEESELYPADECQWLLGTSYNTGIDCLHASLHDEAKKWFETAVSICRYVPNGQARADKVSATYTQLLSRYDPLET